MEFKPSRLLNHLPQLRRWVLIPAALVFFFGQFYYYHLQVNKLNNRIDTLVVADLKTKKDLEQLRAATYKFYQTWDEESLAQMTAIVATVYELENWKSITAATILTLEENYEVQNENIAIANRNYERFDNRITLLEDAIDRAFEAIRILAGY